VYAAREDFLAVARMKVPNASFSLARAAEVSWSALMASTSSIPSRRTSSPTRTGSTAQLSYPGARFIHDVIYTESALSRAPLGTAVVTYNGLSGRMPACYDLLLSERAQSDWLRLWVKRRVFAEGFFVEHDQGIVLHTGARPPVNMRQ
jgi:hypothetical protein